MKKIIKLLIYITPLLFIKIPPYIELNNLKIIEEIEIYNINKRYEIRLKEKAAPPNENKE